MNHHTRSCILGLIALPMVGCGLILPASAAAVPFVYVANKGHGRTYNVSQFDAPLSEGGALTPLTPATVPTGPIAEAIAVSPQGNSAYVVGEGSHGSTLNEVSQYSVNPLTGELTPKSPATVATPKGAYDIAITPNGKDAYVTNSQAKAVSQYKINPVTGDLSPKSPAKIAIRGIPLLVAVTPNGRYAYVVRLKSNTNFRGTVLAYRIDQKTGALSAKPVASVATALGAEGLAIAPNGKSLYVSSVDPGAVSQFTINPRTGKLTPKSPATVTTGPGAHDLAIAPSGRNVYVITVGNDTVSQYRINQSTGTLGSRPASTAATVLHPQSIAIGPDGQSAYVTSENDGEVSQYTISPATGKIAPLSPATVATTSGSFGVAVTPYANISITFSAPSSAKKGSEFDYKWDVRDQGPSSGWKLVLTDRLPSWTAFRKATTASARCSTPKAGTRGGTVRCRLPKLKTGATWHIQIRVTAKTTHATTGNKVKFATITPHSR